MKTLIFGAGPLGSLYASILHEAGKDVTILARNEHYNFVRENGVVMINEFSGEKSAAKVKVVDRLDENDVYELIIVLIRKNRIPPVLEVLSRNQNIGNILFMGNNVLGFEKYMENLPKEKVLFGFPGAGGSAKDHVVHYVDSEKPNSKRLPVTIGEIDGIGRERTDRIRELFESSGVPVMVSVNIDNWLKYHAVMINPIAGACLMCGDNYKAAADKDAMRKYLYAVKEGCNVLRALGYKKREPAKLNLFFWMPDWFLLNIMKQ
ncbi:MAG: ketopantoate reductase family protein, partial [bacterium]|nr:ketopantoate reductase family protein [bacterium]